MLGRPQYILETRLRLCLTQAPGSPAAKTVRYAWNDHRTQDFRMAKADTAEPGLLRTRGSAAIATKQNIVCLNEHHMLSTASHRVAQKIQGSCNSNRSLLDSRHEGDVQKRALDTRSLSPFLLAQESDPKKGTRRKFFTARSVVLSTF
jgi:hypothetical protein